jgi:hypothetical protein
MITTDEAKAVELAAKASAYCASSTVMSDFLKAHRVMLVALAAQQSTDPAHHAAALINLQSAAATGAILSKLYGQDLWL